MWALHIPACHEATYSILCNSFTCGNRTRHSALWLLPNPRLAFWGPRLMCLTHHTAHQAPEHGTQAFLWFSLLPPNSLLFYSRMFLAIWFPSPVLNIPRQLGVWQCAVKWVLWCEFWPFTSRNATPHAEATCYTPSHHCITQTVWVSSYHLFPRGAFY